MKKIFLGFMAIALVSGTALAASDGGGKKKARKKARTECKMKNCDPKDCDPRNCDPKHCDPKDCDPRNCDYNAGKAEGTCAPASCSGK